MKELIVCLVTVFLFAVSLSGCSSTNDAPDRGEGRPANPTTAITPEDRDKAVQTMKSMRFIAVSCEAYAIDYGFYPEVRSVTELGKLVDGIYSPPGGIDRNDAWGNKFEFNSNNEGYEIRSLGRDGRRDKHEPAGLTGNVDSDIVFSDSRFTQSPFED